MTLPKIHATEAASSLRRILKRPSGGGLVYYNVISNYLATGWASMLSLIAIPLLLKKIGSEEWGVIAICATVQNAFNLLDAGLSVVTQRRFAETRSLPKEIPKLYISFLSVYATIGITGGTIIQLFAPTITQFLSSSPADSAKIETALRILSVQFMFQFTNNVNIGYWTGTEQQHHNNIRGCLFSTIKYVGAIFAVWFTDPNANSYLLVVLIVSVFEFLYNSKSIFDRTPRIEFTCSALKTELKKVLVETRGLSLAALVGILASQIDKIYLSTKLSLSSYGSYVVAANLALGFMQLQHPLLKAFFPRIVTNEYRGQLNLVKGVILLCVFPCLCVASFGYPVLKLWIGDAVIAENATLPFQLILVAVALNSLYNIIYQAIVAQNKSTTILKINIISIIAALTVILFGRTIEDGYIGGIIWLSISTSQLALGLFWLRKQKYNVR